jgi:glyoxylase-like metal-dependent hydrolase (beta-lactamase superfamily II)
MNSLRISCFKNGVWKQNCYLVANQFNEALLIDPGSDLEGICSLISSLKVNPVAILNTHAHYDHIGAVSGLIKRYGIPFYLHAMDKKLLKQANLYRVLFGAKNSIEIPQFDQDFSGTSGDLKIRNFFVKVIDTPGHTEGSVCLAIGKNLFTGDTLISKKPGRADLPGGNQLKLNESLLKFDDLSGDHVVYAGHGAPFYLQEYRDLHDV